MDYLDKLIPFAILGVVGGFVFFLLRRAAREKDSSPTRSEMPIVKVEPVVITAPEPALPAKYETPAPVPAKIVEEIKAPVIPAAPVAAPADAKRIKKKRKRILIPVSVTPKGPTPIGTVMGLLKEKESLAAAFLLREILAPPVSKRKS